MLVNKDLKVFVAKRVYTKSKAWQMPQGGINDKETPETAILRELKEEIGTMKVHIIARAKRKYTYDLPANLVGFFWHGQYRGQRQIWYLMRFEGEDSDININTAKPEFSQWKWVDIERLTKVVVPFKRDVYQGVIDEFRPIVENNYFFQKLSG